MDTGNHPLAKVVRLYRRTLMVAVMMASAAIIIGFSLGYPIVGLGAAAGVGLGGANAIGMESMVGRSIALRATKGQIAMGSMRRLGAVTAGIFVLFLLDRNAGLGSLVGLAVFQMLALTSTARTALRQLKSEIGP
ncbi:MAG: hypothetical protein ACRD0J_02510 [Acidimicrobiales bacterium]